MIKENTLYFGYGDIAVSSNTWGYSPIVNFTDIKPPCKCGETITKEMQENIEFGKSINIEMNDYDLYDLLCSIDETNKVIKYKEYTLDFTEYNKESVRVCKDGVRNALLIYQLSLAC
jgi:hypothetical protein